eukprot:576197-Amphidinium_carterae.1
MAFSLVTHCTHEVSNKLIQVIKQHLGTCTYISKVAVVRCLPYVPTLGLNPEFTCSAKVVCSKYESNSSLRSLRLDTSAAVLMSRSDLHCDRVSF